MAATVIEVTTNPKGSPGRRWWWALSLVVVVVSSTAAFLLLRTPFPSDRTPEGAYVRIAGSLGKGDPNGIFPYLETDAHWAAYSIRDARKEALSIAERSYPTEAKDKMRLEFETMASAPDGADVVSRMGEERGWFRRLRKDLSGVSSVEIVGERATIVTAQGTRYPFRRRENGIWGLTIFTAELVNEKERAARDLLVVKEAAEAYERAK